MINYQMKFLYEYCDIKKAFDKAKKERQNGYCYESLFDMVEEMAIKEKGGYPTVYPWLK